MRKTPFKARPASTVNIDVSASSQKVKVADDNGDVDIRIHNDGTATVWIEFGVTTDLTAATTTGIPIGSGVTEVQYVPPLGSDVYVAAIAAGSTGKIYFTPGSGL